MADSTKRTRLYASSALVAALVFALVNVVVAYSVPTHNKKLTESVIRNSPAETRQQGKWSWWLSRAFFSQAKPADVAVFGSSQMGSASFSAEARTLKQDVDCVEHREIQAFNQMLTNQLHTPVKTFNFSMGGAMVSDAFMISQALFRDGNKPKLVVIGVGPRDFMDNTLPSPSATDPFQFFSPYVEIGSLSGKAFSDQFAYMDWWLDKSVPLKRLHHLAVEKGDEFKHSGEKQIASVAGQSKASKKMLQAVSGSTEEVRRGEWVIPGWFVHNDWVDNSSEYVRRYKTPNPPVYPGEVAFFEAFLEHMKQENIQVLVVGMPSLPCNRALLTPKFWGEFRSMVATTCAKNSATWLDLTDSPDFVQYDYLDTVHLDGGGGRKLFAKVAEFVANQPKFMAALKPNHQAETANGISSREQSASLGNWQ